MRKSVLLIYMDMPLASARTGGRIWMKFNIQEFVLHKSAPGKYEHSSSKKYGRFRWAPGNKTAIFFENGCNYFD
jgi:hypothetical protein